MDGQRGMKPKGRRADFGGGCGGGGGDLAGLTRMGRGSPQQECEALIMGALSLTAKDYETLKETN